MSKVNISYTIGDRLVIHPLFKLSNFLLLDTQVLRILLWHLTRLLLFLNVY
jgi:hypothetical protein